jgi:hypothetical protein
MKPLKNILFFVLFSITLSNVTGNTVSDSHTKLFFIENIANSEQSCSDSVLSESEITNDEVNICQLYNLNGNTTTGQDIYTKNCTFLPCYSNTCWQPPQIS